MQLWIALRLPNLPLESRSPPTDTPAVVFERHGNRRSVLCANARAEKSGINPGMALGAATALAPDLVALERKPAGERTALSVLATLAYRFSGSVSVQATAPAPRMHTVWLEVGSSLRLFKGLEPLLDQLRTALDALGYRYRLGIAPTLECASLLADGWDGGDIHPKPLAKLRQLPLSLLEIPEDMNAALHGSGLRNIGEILDLPIDELAMRFGQSLPDYLGRLTGRLPDTRRFYRPPEKYRRRIEFDAELESLEALLFPMRRLLSELQSYLIACDTGVQEFSLELEHPKEHSGGKPTELAVGMSASSRDAAHLLLLLRERFERTPMPAPVRAMTLRAERFSMPRVVQRTLFEDKSKTDEEWQSVLDRLRIRLGSEAVRSLGLNDDYRPEKSWRYLPPCEVGDRIAEQAPRQRPLWLLPEPRPLEGIPQCVSGPERLESGWWDGLDAMRDYYQARTRDGARLWVYRDRRSGGWFLQGLWS